MHLIFNIRVGAAISICMFMISNLLRCLLCLFSKSYRQTAVLEDDTGYDHLSSSIIKRTENRN